ncbi:hypothetical protein PMI16_01948 [Herbaspirillum sp. CF444]|uniref:hypothetical protein n=1 Tax=Herbaspirillum sp. CF444 TaxID=1144319 RepID=UPI0002724BCA|nr:hypothetical protein [Herbaspirillum sp. CF444]EJL89756.1 hypothetical protein PMI16_01948 [Herbaspirillum sp. CF444]
MTFTKSVRNAGVDQTVQTKRHAPAGFVDNRETTAQLRLVQAMMNDTGESQSPMQRMPEEEPLQGKFAPVQRVEEEPLQGKFAATNALQKKAGIPVNDDAGH